MVLPLPYQWPPINPRDLAQGPATELATTGAPVDIASSPPPVRGQVPVATDPTHAVWASPPPLLHASGATLLPNQWMNSSQAGGAVTAPAGAGAGDAFGVYMDGAFSATVTPAPFQFIVSPELPDPDLRVFPPASITLNGNFYYEWVMNVDGGWRPRIAPPSPIYPFRFRARLVSTTNIILSGAQVIDGVTTGNDRILVAGQTIAADNGPYLSTAGAWRRAPDANRSAMLSAGLIIPIAEGNVANRGLWSLTTTGAITLGTTALTFAKISV
jgi:hypothetical protein